MIPDNQKAELYLNWQLQESLLQTYRSLGLTFQAMLLAVAGGIVAFFYQDAGQGPVPATTAKIALMWLSIMAICALGIVSMRQLIRVTRHRGNLVTMYQNLLAMSERGELVARLMSLGIEKNPPYYSASQVVDLADARNVAERGSTMSADTWNFFREQYLQNENHRATRSMMRRFFGLYLTIAWCVVLVLCVFITLAMYRVV